MQNNWPLMAKYWMQLKPILNKEQGSVENKIPKIETCLNRGRLLRAGKAGKEEQPKHQP